MSNQLGAQRLEKQFRVQCNGIFLANAHIYNMSSSCGAVSDSLGIAVLSVFAGDTMLFSSVGFKQSRLFVDSVTIEQDIISFFVETDTVHINEVVVNRQWQLEQKMRRMSPRFAEIAKVKRNLEGATQFAVKKAGEDAFNDHYFNSYPVKGQNDVFLVRPATVHYYLNLLKH